jgi:hypothetical protein
MPKGPHGEKRPADVIGAAVMVGRIATGEVEDTKTEKNSRHHPAEGKWVSLNKAAIDVDGPPPSCHIRHMANGQVVL